MPYKPVHDIALAVAVHGQQHNVLHLVRVKICKGEARSLTGVLVVGDHRITQAAGLAHYRQSAVAHGDHLRKTAGLKAGGHKQEISSGVYYV